MNSEINIDRPWLRLHPYGPKFGERMIRLDRSIEIGRLFAAFVPPFEFRGPGCARIAERTSLRYPRPTAAISLHLGE
jgi:hypothetical protein